MTVDPELRDLLVGIVSAIAGWLARHYSKAK